MRACKDSTGAASSKGHRASSPPSYGGSLGLVFPQAPGYNFDPSSKMGGVPPKMMIPATKTRDTPPTLQPAAINP